VRLIACLNLYNEAPWIERVLAALRENGVDCAIAVDGAYQGFPHEQWWSSDGMLDVLREHSRDGWLHLVPAPANGWPGQEVKRTAYLRVADMIAQPGDWLVQVDGDEVLAEDREDWRGWRLRDYLAQLRPEQVCCYVAIADCDEQGTLRNGGQCWAKVYRWEPGLYYGAEHWEIIAPDGRRVWDLAMDYNDPRAAVWPNFRFHHMKRANPRLDAKSSYNTFRAQWRAQHGVMNPNPTPEVASNAP
jgi:hypothetical protein